jgi:hypothetical protein
MPAKQVVARGSHRILHNAHVDATAQSCVDLARRQKERLLQATCAFDMHTMNRASPRHAVLDARTAHRVYGTQATAATVPAYDHTCRKVFRSLLSRVV